MKIILNPLLWIALGILVFIGLLIADVHGDQAWLSAILFIPCLVMTILTGIGAFEKLKK